MATREICRACGEISAVGFSVSDKVWEDSVPKHLRKNVLCLRCFARFADENLIHWDKDIQFFPVSYLTHRMSLRM